MRLGLGSGHQSDSRRSAVEDGLFLQTNLDDFIENVRISPKGGNGDEK